MKEGDYVVCKKDYYIDDFTFKLFRKKTFKKDSRYRIDSVKQSYAYFGPSGTSGAAGVSGVSGTSGTSGTFPYTVASTTTTSLASTTTSTLTSTCTTTITASTTTTTTAIYSLASFYIVNDVHVSEDMLKEYFYSKIEERSIKLKRLNEKEKIF